MESDIGVIGLGVMGTSLARNIESRGYRVSVFNRPHSGKEDKIGAFKSKFGKSNFFATDNLEKFVQSLSKPRKILLMVKAGAPVDEVIGELVPMLSKSDIIIDGGNSDFQDTQRRLKLLEEKGLLYVGMGISGGEKGALNGPSIMASGSARAWEEIGKIFLAIAARADDGAPCCLWTGPEGSGHFVKTVHNAIEYGDMQLIGEAYFILKKCAGLDNGEISYIFGEWNRGKLGGYLLEITSKILSAKAPDGEYIVDKILDCASQKGTGKLALKTAVDENVPFGLIAQAVFARFASARLQEREKAAKLYPDSPAADPRAEISPGDIEDALYASKIMSYAQGFALMRSVSIRRKWNLDLAAVARVWRNGSIIRSVFLDRIARAYESDTELENLIFDGYFADAMRGGIERLRKAASLAMARGCPIPCMAAALSAFDSMRTLNSSAALIQAQRDYFGAHTYERIDSPRGEFFHTDWASLEAEKTEE